MEVKPRICVNLSTAADVDLADLLVCGNLSRGRGPWLDARSLPVSTLSPPESGSYVAVSAPDIHRSPGGSGWDTGLADQCGRRLTTTTFEDHVPKDQLA